MLSYNTDDKYLPSNNKYKANDVMDHYDTIALSLKWLTL